jgi:hypothetical protein
MPKLKIEYRDFSIICEKSANVKRHTQSEYAYTEITRRLALIHLLYFVTNKRLPTRHLFG